MPYSSAQISGLIGGQTAMFSNQSAYAQQISGGMWGISQPVGGMQNPYPTYAQPQGVMGENVGAQIAGGMGMALPGAATGATIGAGLIGGRMGWLDPFTAGGRMFARGIGAQGMGMGGTLGHLGGIFRTAGMRAGMGALGTGLGAAAATALPFAAIGYGIQRTGESIYAGAQDVGEVGQLAQQYMAPQYGQPGARAGGQLGRHQVRNIVSMMQDIAGEDVMQSMDSLKRLMDRAGQMGMFAGTMDPREFRRKFKGIVSQTRQIARILGGTLEEALPVVNQLTQMGLWTSRDILGTAVAMRGVGPQAAPHMLATMQAGAQMSHAMGGRMQAGAFAGRQAFMDIQAMQRMGALSERDVRQFTGGVGGAAGQQQMAQQLTGIMGQFGRTAGGRLMLAGLGEVGEEGQFTGRMSQERLNRFLRGDIGLGELQQMGRRQTAGRVGAMSFHRRQETLGQELMARGGVEAMGTMIERAMERGGYTQGGAFGDEARHQFIQKMLGVSNRQAELLGDMIKRLPEIRAERARQMESALNESFRNVEERMNRSWSGVGQAIEHSWDQFWRPVREFGSDLATSFGEAGDEITDTILGRIRDIPITHRERIQRLREGALTQRPMQTFQQLGITGIGQRAMETGWAERIRRQGFFGGTTALAFGGEGMWQGSRAQAMVEAGLQTGGQGVTLEGIQTPYGAGAMGAMGAAGGPVGRAALGAADIAARAGVQLPGFRRRRVTASLEEVQFTQGRMVQRAMGATLGQMGYRGVDRKDMESVKSGLRRLMTDPRTANQLREWKEEDPDTYNRRMVDLLQTSDPEARAAMERLSNRPGARGSADSRRLDILSAAQGEAKLGAGELAAQFGGDIVPNFANLDEVREFESARVREASEALGGMRATEAMGWGAAVGTMVFPGLGTLMGAAGGAIYRAVTAEDQLSEAEAREMLTGGMAGDISAYVESIEQGGTVDNEFTRRALSDRDSTEAKLMRLLQQSGREERQQFMQAAQRFGASRGARVGLRERERLKELARAQGRLTTQGTGLQEDTIQALNQIVQAYGEGNVEQAQELAGGLAGGLGGGELRRLGRGRGGVFGRQVAGLGMIGQMPEEMTGRQWEQFQTGLGRAMGGDVVGALSDEQRNRIREMVESGGGVDIEESTRIREMLRNLVQAIGPGQGAGARKTTNESMIQQLNAYTAANEKFVFTATEALVKLGRYDTEEATEEFKKATTSIRGAQTE